MPIFPRRALIAIATTAVALALMFSFKTPEATLTRAPGGVVSAPTDQGAGATRRPGTTPRPGTTVPAPSGAPVAAGTITGQDIQTQFGDVQVQITIANGRITQVEALQLPSHGRSGSISQAVAPMLHDEALQAQSAKIDIVSGATYTSEAYAQSLQSALDQAHG
jgi:uncharacterized protein with FMN-binding domain